MSSPVVGYATLQVIPSLRGVHELIRRELAAGAGQTGRGAGEQIGRSMGSGLSSALSASAQVAFRALEGASLAAGAGAAAALVKGYGRFTTIEDAQAALTISLQSSTAAAELLGDTLEVVQGTPFRLDQFAAASQRMAGMGIEAQKIPAYLTAIGEASATQGKAANEYADRLSRVFGQVAAQGQLQLIDVWRISDTGVNALAILANSFGVTRDEMKDMISDGAVPAGQALDALARGILEGSDGPAGATTALAGTMESLRLTLSGAAAGADAALARFGATLIAPFSPAATAGLNAFSESLDILGESVSDTLGTVADSAGMERFVDLLESAPDRVDGLVGALGDLGPLAGGAASALAAVGTRGLGTMLGPLGMLVPGGSMGPLGIVAAGIAGIALASPEARDALSELARSAAPVAADLGEELAPLLPVINEALADLMPAAVRLAEAALVTLGGAAVDTAAAAVPLVDALLGIATPTVVAGLELVTDLIEDHGDVVLIAAGGYATLKAAALASAGASVVTGLFAVGGALEGITLRAMYAAQGVGQVAAGLVTLPAATNFSRVTAGVDNLKTSVSGLAGGISAVSTSLVVVGGVGFAAWQIWQNEARKAEDALDSLYERLDIDPETVDLYEIQDALAGMSARVNDLNDGLQEYDGLVGGLRVIGEFVDPSTPNDFAALANELGVTAEEAERLYDRFTVLSEAARMAGMDWEEFGRWADRLDFDPATDSAIDMAIALNDATRLADAGSPVVDSLADSFETLTDETASATDQMEAYSDVLDALIGTQASWEQTQLGFHDQIAELATAQRDARFANEEWSTSLFESDEASRRTRETVAGLVQEALNLSTSFFEAGGGIDGATWKLAEARDQIIRAGVAAGISEQDMIEYLAVLGLTPENIETAVRANADQGSIDAVNTAIEAATAPRTVTVTLNMVGLIQTLQELDNAWAGRGPLGNRMGGVYEFARGGVTPAHIASGTLYKYAEPETGGEAFIPRLGNRERSIGIMETVGGWLDVGIIDKKQLAAGRSTKTLGGQRTAPVVHFHGIPMDTAAELEAEGGYRLRQMGLVAR